MLSKFFKSLKPKEYSVQVLRDNTSQSAVKRIKRTRTSSPLRKIATVTLVLSFIGGGLVSASAATAVTAKQAQANIISDNVCITADSDNAGSWNGGAKVWGTVGGSPAWSVNNITKDTVPSDAAYNGQAAKDWGTIIRNSPDIPSGGKYLTAYEKYGYTYPYYDSWKPVFADKAVTVKQVDTTTGSYSTADGKLPTKGGNEIQPGASPLLTSDIGSCIALLPMVDAGIANMFAVFPKFLMSASIELYSTAYGSSISDKSSILYAIGNQVNQLITKPGGLKDSLFIPFTGVLLLFGALYVGYWGVVKKAAMKAVQSTTWMILAIALGTVFLAQPTLVSSFVDSTVAQVQKITNEAVMSGSNTTDMCNINGSGDSKETIRETKCTIWHSTIFTTWSAGQFGEAANSANSANSVLTQGAGRQVLKQDAYKIYYGSENAAQATTWPQFMLDREVTTKSPELTEVAWAQLSGQAGATINPEWSGNIGMVSSAIIMFFGAGASSAVLFVYGFALLIYQLMMISAVLMSPFFFLLGIVPNWGRRVLMRYAELLTSLAVKRIVTGLMLAFYLLFYNLIVGGAEYGGMMLLKIIIIFALALFFITARTKFIKIFADSIDFGGNKSIGLPGNKAVAVAAGLGAGLLGGGILGAAVVGHKTRKQNKDTEGKIDNIRLEGSPTADIKPSPRGPSSAGNGGGGANPVQAANKVANTVKDVKNIKDTAQNFIPTPSNSAPTAPVPTAPAEAAQVAQGAANASGGATSGTTGAAGSQAASGAAQGATQGAGATVKAAGTQLAPKGMSLTARMAARGGTQAAGSAAGTAGTSASGIAAGGAAATGGAGAAVAPVATGAGAAAAGSGAGIAAGGAAAGGTAAAGGAVAAGAAAGSVVPVVGTAVGAAAAAAVVAASAKKKSENNGGKSGQG